MSIRRITSLIVVLILNLVIGYFYIEPFKIPVVSKANFANESDLKVTSSESALEKKIEKGSAITENLTRLVTPEIVFPLPLQYLINPNDLCSRTSPIKSKMTVLILVCTAVGNIKQRQAIRKTWGSIASSNNNTGYIRLAFLIGSTGNETLQEQIRKEAKQHSDIVQQDFVDSYQNLTLKSVMLLRWVNLYCPNVQYVLKSDDDMFVNVPNLVKTLVRLPVKSNVIYGVLFKKARPNRHPSAKWFVPKSQFNGNVFPDYVSGTAYVMSRDVVPKLLEASAALPFLVMEDVFITGLCASESRVKRFNVKGFAHWKRAPTGCAFRDVITGHHVTPADMNKIWGELQKKSLKCRTPKKKYRKQ